MPVLIGVEEKMKAMEPIKIIKKEVPVKEIAKPVMKVETVQQIPKYQAKVQESGK